MSLSLEDFVEEIQQKAEKFRTDYEEASEKNGKEAYPLEIETGNEGLWIEFFIHYYYTEQV